MTLSATRSPQPSMMMVVMSVILVVGRCSRHPGYGVSSSSQSAFSPQIPQVNSTAIPADHDHKFLPENVLTSFLKLSQERSRVLDPVLSSNFSVEDKWVSSVNFISSLTTLVIKASLPLSVSLTYQKDLSSKCSASLLQILGGLRENRAWAFSFIDSSGRLPAGLLTGSLTDLGDYDQCRKIRVGDQSQRPLFQGQYCLAKLRPALPPPKPGLLINDVILSMDKMPSLRNTVYEDVARNAHGFYSLPIQMAVCIPSVCSSNEIAFIMRKSLDPFFVSVELGPTCDIDTSGDQSFFKSLNRFQIFALLAILLFVLVALLSSIVELCIPCDHGAVVGDGSCLKVLLSFSVMKSSRKLFSKERESHTKLHFVHGMRVMTMIWIIVCHTYTYGTQFLTEIGCVRILEDIRPKKYEFSMQLVLNGWLSVETFFFLSGIIVTYIVHPVLIKAKGKLDFFKYVSLRWMRFTPGLFGVMMIHFLWPLLGSGPMWKERTETLMKPCYTSWWQNFLYINNWVQHHEDILHVLAYFPLVLMYHSRARGLTATSFLMVLGGFIPALLVHYKSLPPTMIANTAYIETFDRYFVYFHFPTFNHLTPYFMGVMVGYILVTRDKLMIGRHLETGLWFLLPAAAVITVFSTIIWNGYEIDAGPVTSFLYAGLHRFVWTAGVAWIALCCGLGRGGVVRNILTSRFWLPFSRLSYQIYLIHFVVIYYHFLSQRKPIYFSHYDHLFATAAVMVLSLVLAYVCFLLFEAPFAALMKMLVARLSNKPEEDAPQARGLNMTVMTVATCDNLSFVNPDYPSS